MGINVCTPRNATAGLVPVNAVECSAASLPGCPTAAGFRHVITAANASDGYVDIVLGGSAGTANADAIEIMRGYPGAFVAEGAVMTETIAGAGRFYISDVLRNGKSIMPAGYFGPAVARLTDAAYQADLNFWPPGLPAAQGQDSGKLTIRLVPLGAAAPVVADVLEGAVFVTPVVAPQ